MLRNICQLVMHKQVDNIITMLQKGVDPSAAGVDLGHPGALSLSFTMAGC